MEGGGGGYGNALQRPSRAEYLIGVQWTFCLVPLYGDEAVGGFNGHTRALL